MKGKLFHLRVLCVLFLFFYSYSLFDMFCLIKVKEKCIVLPVNDDYKQRAGCCKCMCVFSSVPSVLVLSF